MSNRARVAVVLTAGGTAAAGTATATQVRWGQVLQRLRDASQRHLTAYERLATTAS